MSPGELLRDAAFADPQRAAAAWDAWSRTRELDVLDPVELRMLPLVYRNLRAAGVSDAEIAPVVKQMARSMFVRTRLLLHRAAVTVELLSSEGIESILLKGAGLVAGGYCDAAVRPMSDFDLFIRPSDAARAAALLEADRWRTDPPIDRRAITFRHAALFKKDEWECDLHWWALWDSRDAAADERFRAGAEAASLDGMPVRILRPEHQLLHVIVHGTRSFDLGAVRWIGDSLAVLRGRPLDWRLFVDEAGARRMAQPVAEALAYLVERFQAAVPDGVVAELRSRRVPVRRRRLYAPRPAARINQSVAFLRALVQLSLEQRKGTPLLTRLLWLPRNLQYVLGARTLARLPAALARRGLRVLRQGVSGRRAARQAPNGGKRTRTISSG